MSCHCFSFLVSVSGVLDCQFHPTQPWIFTAGADHQIRLYTWQYSFSTTHSDYRVPQVAVKGGLLREWILQSWSLNRSQRDTTLEQRLTFRRISRAFSGEFLERFSLEGLQTNMPYPYGYRLTCYLRRTWLDNIFKPLHEDLPRTKVVLPNMWQVVNKKTPRIVFASNDSSHKQTFSRTCKLHFVNWQWKNIK